MGLALFCSVSRPTHVWTLPRARHRPGGQWRHAHPAPLHRPNPAGGPAVPGTLPDELRELEQYGFDINDYLADNGREAV